MKRRKRHNLEFMSSVVPCLVAVHGCMMLRLVWFVFFINGDKYEGQPPNTIRFHFEAFFFIGIGNIKRFASLDILRRFLRLLLGNYNRKKEMNVWVLSKRVSRCTGVVLFLLTVAAGITAQLWTEEVSSIMFNLHSVSMLAYSGYVLHLVDKHLSSAKGTLKSHEKRRQEENRLNETEHSFSISNSQSKELVLATKIKRELLILRFARYGLILGYIGYLARFLATSTMVEGVVDQRYFYELSFNSVAASFVLSTLVSFSFSIKFYVHLMQAWREVSRSLEGQPVLPPIAADGPGLVAPVQLKQTVRPDDLPPISPDDLPPSARDLEDQAELKETKAQEEKLTRIEQQASVRLHEAKSIMMEGEPVANEVQQNGLVISTASHSIRLEDVDMSRLRKLIEEHGATPVTTYRARLEKEKKKRLDMELEEPLGSTSTADEYAVHTVGDSVFCFERVVSSANVIVLPAKREESSPRAVLQSVRIER
eukprot:g58181.t1